MNVGGHSNDGNWLHQWHTWGRQQERSKIMITVTQSTKKLKASFSQNDIKQRSSLLCMNFCGYKISVFTSLETNTTTTCTTGMTHAS